MPPRGLSMRLLHKPVLVRTPDFSKFRIGRGWSHGSRFPKKPHVERAALTTVTATGAPGWGRSRAAVAPEEQPRPGCNTPAGQGLREGLTQPQRIPASCKGRESKWQGRCRPGGLV